MEQIFQRGVWIRKAEGAPHLPVSVTTDTSTASRTQAAQKFNTLQVTIAQTAVIITGDNPNLWHSSTDITQNRLEKFKSRTSFLNFPVTTPCHLSYGCSISILSSLRLIFLVFFSLGKTTFHSKAFQDMPPPCFSCSLSPQFHWGDPRAFPHWTGTNNTLTQGNWAHLLITRTKRSLTPHSPLPSPH